MQEPVDILLCPSVLISHYIVVLPFIIYLIANIYAADVNQLAALSEDVDNEEPQKSKRGKKSKTSRGVSESKLF